MSRSVTIAPVLRSSPVLDKQGRIECEANGKPIWSKGQVLGNAVHYASRAAKARTWAKMQERFQELDEQLKAQLIQGPESEAVKEETLTEWYKLSQALTANKLLPQYAKPGDIKSVPVYRGVDARFYNCVKADQRRRAATGKVVKFKPNLTNAARQDARRDQMYKDFLTKKAA